MVPLAVVDVEAKAKENSDYVVSREDLAAWEHKHGRLPNCCVAMHSGWAAHLSDATKFTGKDSSGVFHFPGFGIDTANG